MLNPDVDAYLARAARWPSELRRLCAICLDTPLTEELKWRQPCYTLDGKNVVIVSAFSSHACLSFFKGALLDDEHDLLVAPGKHTQAGRQMRFTSVDQINTLEPIIRAYIAEAIRVEQAGMAVRFKTTQEYDVPAELAERLHADASLHAAWSALTPGRQRGYIVHIAGAKQSKTRYARIDRHRPRILAGKGIHDR